MFRVKLLTVRGRVGEETTEALHQPHSLRELHIAGGAGCVRQSYAEYDGPCLFRNTGGLTKALQINTPKGIPEQDTTAAMSSSTHQKGYASKEHWKHSDWTPNNGESMCNVRALNVSSLLGNILY